MAKRPVGTLPQKLPKRAELMGGYRMFNNRKVTHQAILKAHRASCLQRLEGYQGKLLLLHDTTVLDYSGLDVQGLGQVGDGHGKGLYAHNSLAVIPSTRQVVGLLNQILHQRAWVPRGESKKKRAARSDRESRLWKQAVADLPALPAGIVVTDVSDRGSDISEYICYEISANRQFIVRSQHNRQCVDEQGEPSIQKLHDHLGGLKPADQYLLRVRAAEGGWREAKMAVAWAPVRLLPPRQPRGEHGPEPIELCGVIAREIDPPPGDEPIEWILLTNRQVTSPQQALEVLEDYSCRWLIEICHPYCLHCHTFDGRSGQGLGRIRSAA